MQRNKGTWAQDRAPVLSQVGSTSLSSLLMISRAGHLFLCPLLCRESLELTGHLSAQGLSTHHTVLQMGLTFLLPGLVRTYRALHPVTYGSVFISVATSQCPPHCPGLVSIFSSCARPTPLAETMPIPSLCINPKLDSHVCKSRSVTHCRHPDDLRFTAKVTSLHLESEGRGDIGHKRPDEEPSPSPCLFTAHFLVRTREAASASHYVG